MLQNRIFAKRKENLMNILKYRNDEKDIFGQKLFWMNYKRNQNQKIRLSRLGIR